MAIANETVRLGAAEDAQREPAKQAGKGEPSKKTTRRRPVKKRAIITYARRKEAGARARLVPGIGMLLINGRSVYKMQNKYLRELVLEPVSLSLVTQELARNANIYVNVKGGGISGQMQAARSAIAKAIARFSKDEVVKNMYMNYDRSLLVDDVRQVEPKKFKGPKARARFQKSYR
ncbi:MAG: 30S ribosomal protein S9 [Candidatus Micrarchaeaceae archaeon]